MKNLLLTILRIGRVKLADDTGPIQTLQAFEGDLSTYGGGRTIDKVPKMGHYGHVSVPPLDAEILLAFMNGDRSLPLVIGSNHQASRLKNLQPGDAGIHDVRGAKMTLTAAGWLIDAAGLPIVVQNFSSCTIKGDLHVEGDVVSRSAGTPVSLNGLRDAYNAHGHEVTGGAGTITDPTDHEV